MSEDTRRTYVDGNLAVRVAFVKFNPKKKSNTKQHQKKKTDVDDDVVITAPRGIVQRSERASAKGFFWKRVASHIQKAS